MSGRLDPLLRAVPAEPAVAAVARLFLDHRQRLLGLAAAITLDRAAAEDIVQDAFAGLQRHVEHVDNAVGYLQRSVINLGVNFVRRRTVVRRHPPPRALSAGNPEIDETWTAVLTLPAKQRAVVVLRFWEDMTIDAIAEVLGLPAGSVKSTLHRALRRLEGELR